MITHTSLTPRALWVRLAECEWLSSLSSQFLGRLNDRRCHAFLLHFLLCYGLCRPLSRSPVVSSSSCCIASSHCILLAIEYILSTLNAVRLETRRRLSRGASSIISKPPTADEASCTGPWKRINQQIPHMKSGHFWSVLHCGFLTG